MSKSDKRLDAMRRNPRADWTIQDVRALCRTYGVDCANPTGGSHYAVSHSSQNNVLVVPARRPIKAIYIKKLVTFIDRVRGRDGR